MDLMKPWIWQSAIGVLLSLSVSACSASGGAAVPPAEPNGNTVDLLIEAVDFQFNEPEYRVRAGDTVNVTFKNIQGVHGVEIKGYHIRLRDNDTATFVAAPGEYLIICNIPCGIGHSNMVSKLIVEE